MVRFRNWRSERRIASRDTSPNVRTVPPPARAPATALVPSAQAELSDGVVVDAHVRGRLLGINLLYLHARVNIAPAVMLGSTAALPPERSPAGLRLMGVASIARASARRQPATYLVASWPRPTGCSTMQSTG